MRDNEGLIQDRVQGSMTSETLPAPLSESAV